MAGLNWSKARQRDLRARAIRQEFDENRAARRLEQEFDRLFGEPVHARPARKQVRRALPAQPRKQRGPEPPPPDQRRDLYDGLTRIGFVERRGAFWSAHFVSRDDEPVSIGSSYRSVIDAENAILRRRARDAA